MITANRRRLLSATTALAVGASKPFAPSRLGRIKIIRGYVPCLLWASR